MLMTKTDSHLEEGSPRLAGEAAARASAWRRWLTTTKSLRPVGMLPALVVVIIVGALTSPSFLTVSNLETVLNLTSVIGILAIGETLVIISGGGGIDLSVGGVLAASTVVGSLYSGYGLVGFVLAALAAGAFFGLINGLGVTRGALQPFIVTLATMTIARGVAFYLSDGVPRVVNLAGIKLIGSGSLWVIPIPIVVFLCVVVLAHVFLRYTVWGRELYAIGGTEEAAYVSGVPVRRRRMTVYVASGLLAGLAGVLSVSFIATADPSTASGYELDAIAAAVVGGAMLRGGVGSALGTIVGVLIIAFTGNILTLQNVNPFIQLIVNGLIVLVAVSLEARGRSSGGNKKSRLLGLGTMFGTIAAGAVFMFTVLA